MLTLLLCATFVAIASAAPQSLPWLRLEAPLKSTNDILKFEPMTPFEDIWANYKLTHRKCALSSLVKKVIQNKMYQFNICIYIQFSLIQ